MLKCAIFDMDGTVADTLPLCIEAFRRSIEPLCGKTLTDKEIVATFGPSEEGTIQAFIPEQFDRGVDDYRNWYRKLHREMCAAPFEGITGLLRELKDRGVKVAMVTGKGRKSLDITLGLFGMTGLFDDEHTGSPKGINKPQGIKGVLEKFKLSPGEAVYIGDAPSDIHSSRRAGVPVISAAWAEIADPEELKLLEPDWICYSIAELRELLLSMI